MQQRIRANWQRCALLLLLGIASAPALAQQEVPDEPDVIRQVWRTEDGLPHNAVTALHQTRDGYLWIGTAAGLARFDGLRFVSVSDEHAPHLAYSYVWSLHEDTDGTLWVGTGDGLTHIDGGRFTTLTTQDGLPVNFVRGIARDRDGHLWVGTYGGGVCRFDSTAPDDRRFTCFDAADGLPSSSVNNLWVDEGGGLHVATDAGVSRWRNGRWLPDGPSVGSVTTRAAGSGTAEWWGTSGGLVRIENANVEPLLFDGEPLGAVRALLREDEGALWIGTESKGLFRYLEGTFQRFQASGMLSHDDVRAIARDREGNVWVGTNGGGLNRLRAGRVRVYAADDGLPSNIVNAVLEDRTGQVWLATSGGLVRIADEQMRIFAIEDGLPTTRVLSLAEDADGTLWVGTNGGGLARYTDGTFTTFTEADGLPGDVIFGLFTDRQGRVWVGGQGLAVWTGDGFERFAPADGLADGLIVTFAEEPSGAIWFGSDDAGLSRYADGRFTTFAEADGLPSASIRALHFDDAGALWIGTRGGGLSRYADGKFATVTTEQGLPDNIVFHILEDDRGALWINTGRSGIARLQKAEFDAVAQGVAEQVAPLLLGRADGLRSTEGVGGFHPSGWKARNGRLWFPTHEGVAVVDPARIAVDPVPPPVHIEEVLVNDEPVVIRSGGLRLEPDADRIEIRYTGLSFADPHRVQFRYQLGGQDDEWKEAGPRRSRTYDNLAPGHYTFRVTAANPDGVWNATPAELAITVVPPWWRTVWALGLWGLLLGTGAYGVFRWRVRSLRQHNEELEALVAARTAQVQAQAEQLREMDRTKSRFFANLSHEFRTPLTLIQGPIDSLLEQSESERDRAMLRGMRAQSQRLLRLINQLLDLAKLDAGGVPLQPKRGDLVPFLRTLTASFAGLADVRCVTLDLNSATPSIGMAFDTDKLEQVATNLVSNALKFTPEGGKVQVSLDADDTTATIRVRDTGPGIPPDAIDHIFDRFYQADTSTDGLGTGIGLALSRELVALHGGTLEVESAPGFGSTFTVCLPRTLDPADATTEAEDSNATVAGPIEPEGEVVGVADEASDVPDDAPLVLIVEDHAEVRSFLRETLGSRYRIAEADSGEAGLEAAHAESPDLIVSDVMMPGLDGFDLVRALRADDDLAPVPVILLTARADEESKLEGLDAGADDYLAKPFSAAELLVRAENLIELRRALRSRFSNEVVVGPSQVSVPSADAVFLDEVRDAVEKHIGNTQFGVEWLADEVHLSRRQLHRKLQALTGLSTVAYIRMMRLERATQLLEQQAGNVSEIAARVGFQDPNYFSRIFRQAYGHPPSEHPVESDEAGPATDRT